MMTRSHGKNSPNSHMPRKWRGSAGVFAKIRKGKVTYMTTALGRWLRLPTVALFFLTFFTLPMGMTEGQPLLVLIPIVAWILSIAVRG